MKVAFITSEYPPEVIGGAGISSKLIVEGLSERGINIDVYSLTGEEKTPIQEDGVYKLPSGSNNYNVHPRIGQNISVFRYLPNLSEYDIAHVYNMMPLPSVAAKPNVKVVATVNNLIWCCVDSTQWLREDCKRHSLRDRFRHAKTAGYDGFYSIPRVGIEILGKFLSKKAKMFTVQSNGMKSVIQNCGYPDDKIRVVPNVLDDKFLVDDADSTNTILYVGKFEKHKGPQNIVTAYKKLAQSLKREWKLNLFGSGSLKGSIKSRIEKDDNISIHHKPYDQLPQEYANADIFISSSKWPEPFSRTWLEAMASNTAIIASENPSSKEILSDIAMFYDPFDADDLYTTLKILIKDKRKQEIMKTMGSEAVEDYTLDRVIPQFENVYRNVM